MWSMCKLDETWAPDVVHLETKRGRGEGCRGEGERPILIEERLWEIMGQSQLLPFHSRSCP